MKRFLPIMILLSLVTTAIAADLYILAKESEWPCPDKATLETFLNQYTSDTNPIVLNFALMDVSSNTWGYVYFKDCHCLKMTQNQITENAITTESGEIVKTTTVLMGVTNSFSALRAKYSLTFIEE